MFTGIIQYLGKVIAFTAIQDGYLLTLEAPTIAHLMKEGDSLAVNGCCLTLFQIEGTHLKMHLVPETVERTALFLQPGDLVNLERSLRLQDGLDGHLVQGHIDGKATITLIDKESDDSYWITLESAPEITYYMVEKGSVAIDGISLTLARTEKNRFTIAVIPYTYHHTNLSQRKIGDMVNIETDIVGKYIAKYAKNYTQAI
jgi:riboflavin synthase